MYECFLNLFSHNRSYYNFIFNFNYPIKLIYVFDEVKVNKNSWLYLDAYSFTELQIWSAVHCHTWRVQVTKKEILSDLCICLKLVIALLLVYQFLHTAPSDT